MVNTTVMINSFSRRRHPSNFASLSALPRRRRRFKEMPFCHRARRYRQVLCRERERLSAQSVAAGTKKKSRALHIISRRRHRKSKGLAVRKRAPRANKRARPQRKFSHWYQLYISMRRPLTLIYAIIIYSCARAVTSVALNCPKICPIRLFF